MEQASSSIDEIRQPESIRIFCAKTTFSHIHEGHHKNGSVLAIIKPFTSDYLPQIHDKKDLDEFYNLVTLHGRKELHKYDCYSNELDGIYQAVPQDKARLILKLLNTNPDLKDYIIANQPKSKTQSQPRIFLTFDQVKDDSIFLSLSMHDVGQVRTPIQFSNIALKLDKEASVETIILTGFYPHLLDYGLRGGKLVMLALMNFFANDHNSLDSFRISQPNFTAMGMYHALGFTQFNLYRMTKLQTKNILSVHKNLFGRNN